MNITLAGAHCWGVVMVRASEFDRSDISDLLTMRELCEALSISKETGCNWLKLGKIKPSVYIENRPRFRKQDVEKLKSDIKTGNAQTLKYRRNKRFISGNGLCKAYIEDKKGNSQAVKMIVEACKSRAFWMNNPGLIIAEYAIRLICQAGGVQAEIHKSALVDYLSGGIDLGMYSCLIGDLLSRSGNEGVERSAELLSLLSDVHRADQTDTILGQNLVLSEHEDVLGLLYISLRNMGDRKLMGSYYTPNKIVNQVVGDLLSLEEEVGSKKIFDPCCGTGNFLLHAAQYYSNADNIFGMDIDPIAVQIARINLALYFGPESIKLIYSNLSCGNTLFDTRCAAYDLIVGNPPWGYAFGREETERLSKMYITASRKGTESYDVFLEKAIGLLKDKGTVSFVLPEALLNVRSHRAIRSEILSKTRIKKLNYLGNVFEGVQCPAIILTLQRSDLQFTAIGAEVYYRGRTYTVGTERHMTAESFRLNLDDREYEIIDKMRTCTGCKYLKGNADFALGIVTGSNTALISGSKTSENEPILRGSDIFKYHIAEPRNFIVYDPQKLQQTAPERYYRAREKLVYRFISNSLVFAYDDRQLLTLNSCNILIPRIDGTDIKYILAVLNSSAAQFYFKKMFNSVKVLRSHLEQIPIPVPSPDQHKDVVYLVEHLLEESDTKVKIELIGKIDDNIMDIYKLGRDDRDHIIDRSTGKSTSDIRRYYYI